MNAISKQPVTNIVLFIILALLLFGLVMITSIGVPKSIELTTPDNIIYPSCGSDGVDCYFIAKRHFLRILIGLIAMIVFSKINYTFWKKIAVPLFVLMFILLLIVKIAGSDYNTRATSWLIIFNTSIQPTEFAKLALIFYFASWAERRKDEIQTMKYGFVPFCVISALMILPVILQPDLGSTMVLATISTAIYYIAGARVSHLLLGLIIAIFVSSILIVNIDYLKERFNAFTADDSTCIEDYCWQSEQASIAVGSGGLFGKGLTQGVQKSYWLPQASDDFIFAASSEELGFLKIIFIILAYTAFAYFGFKIAKNTDNSFGKFTAVGITTWIVMQAFINISVNIGLFPVTGITLPFISYGGSSLIASLIAIGVLLNISKSSYSYAYNSNGRRDRRSRNSVNRHYRRN